MTEPYKVAVGAKPLVLRLIGPSFRRTYVLYIVEVKSKATSFFYIGQTGDRRWLTARPAIRRLGALIEDVGYSTQNQVYRYIANDILRFPRARARRAFSAQTKRGVEAFLSKSDVSMTIYPLRRFDDRSSMKQHCRIVDGVVDLERRTIRAFLNAGMPIANRTSYKPILQKCQYPDTLRSIQEQYRVGLA